MILVDSIFINNGGGKVLLDYLVNSLENCNLEVYYLFDIRCRDSYSNIPEERKSYISSSLYSRCKFYKCNKNRFRKVLCFGNIPPPIRLTTPVFTYFHQPLYIKVSGDYSLFEQLKFRLKVQILKLSRANSDIWIVQSDIMKVSLVRRFELSESKIIVLPFFQENSSLSPIIRENKTYIYVSNASHHKNHYRLINAFCMFYDRYKEGKLTLTVSENYEAVYSFILKKQKLGYPIVNIGFVCREDLKKHYLKSEFLIFPSLAESFGLGLIEGIQFGCKVIGAELPYTFEVCYPSLTFDPMDECSIFNALENSRNHSLKESVPIITNRINDLINCLQ